MIKNWVENHLVSDNICNTVNLSSQYFYKEWQENNVGLAFSGGDTTTPRFTISIEEDS